MSTYPLVFKRCIAWSADLSPEHVAAYQAAGYNWVRVVPRKWKGTLRNPTVGRLLELTHYQDVSSVSIDSAAAARLFRRVCGQ
jgi:hypothetical protein